MADATDIGVCQARCPLDYAFLDDLIARIGGPDLPVWSPHVESIVWAALAMHIGGNYLERRAWFCFNYPVTKRLRVRMLKADPMDILRAEPIACVKCFHAGGKAKDWLVDAERAGLLLGSAPEVRTAPTIPFKPYKRAQFNRKQFLLKVTRSLGLMAVVGGHG